MLYNGSNGSVKALQAAMLPDGTAIAVYTLGRSEADAGSYEIAYTIVDSDGELGTTMLATRAIQGSVFRLFPSILA